MTGTFTASNGMQVAWMPNGRGMKVLQTNAEYATRCLPEAGWRVVGDATRASGNPGFTEESALAVALREFFLHERDKELGRWRCPENPNYVVYPEQPSMTEPEPGVRVLHEVTGRSRGIGRGATGACDATLSVFGRAARAFFAAHPEPKPWHAAKPGEIWVITTENVADEVAVQVTPEGTFLDNEGCTWPILDMPILTARRIFPEVVSDA